MPSRRSKEAAHLTFVEPAHHHVSEDHSANPAINIDEVTLAEHADDGEIEENVVAAREREARESFERLRRSVIDDDYDEEVRKMLNSESESESDSVDYEKVRDPLLPEADFFEMLGEVPDISEVSDDLTIRLRGSSISVKSQKTYEEDKDIGVFVDPLTGEVIEPEVEPESSSTIEEVEEEEEEDYSYEDPELLALVEMLEERRAQEEMVTEVAEEEVQLAFFGIEAVKSMHFEEEVDVEQLVQVEHLRKIIRVTIDFIEDLIKNVVATSEYVDPSERLRQKLNKMTIIHDLDKKLGLLEIENKTRVWLNRKVVEVFRKKKQFRYITSDHDHHDREGEAKFKVIAKHLDQLLSQEMDIKIASEKKIEIIKEELSEEQEKAQKRIEYLETLFKKSFARETFDSLQRKVADALQEMSRTRARISNDRLKLFSGQHEVALLTEKMLELETIGEGLHLHSFITLQAETQILDKKLEERHCELVKQHQVFHRDLHMMAHLKEKQSLVRQSIKRHADMLIDLSETKRTLCVRLHKLKLERLKVRRESEELIVNGGLMCKPLLLVDYDATDDRLAFMRNRTSDLRLQLKEIVNKIRRYERIAAARRDKIDQKK